MADANVGDWVRTGGGSLGKVVRIERPNGDRYVTDSGGDTQDRWLAEVLMDDGTRALYRISRLDVVHTNGSPTAGAEHRPVADPAAFSYNGGALVCAECRTEWPCPSALSTPG